MSQSDDRSAEPSGYRISQAREMGHIPLALALVRALALAVSVGLVFATGPRLARESVSMVRGTLQALPEWVSARTSPISIQEVITGHLWKMAEPLLIMTLGVLLSILLLHQLTTGGSWTPSLALPDIGRLMRFWAQFDDETGHAQPPLTHRLILGLAKPTASLAGCLVVILAIGWQWFSPAMINGEWSERTIVAELFRGRSIVGRSLIFMTFPMIGLGVLEFLIHRQHWYERLRPSTEQARRELKELEGDPELKRRRKRLAQEIRESGRIDQLVHDCVLVVIGPSITGLSIQIIRQHDGKLAIGEVVRGSSAARFAEKAAAQGRPWRRHAALARLLVDLTGKTRERPVNISPGLNQTLNDLMKS